jgi:hypothetical protein
MTMTRAATCRPPDSTHSAAIQSRLTAEDGTAARIHRIAVAGGPFCLDRNVADAEGSRMDKSIEFHRDSLPPPSRTRCRTSVGDRATHSRPLPVAGSAGDAASWAVGCQPAGGPGTCGRRRRAVRSVRTRRRARSRPARWMWSQFDLCTDLEHLVRRNAEELGGRARVVVHEGEQPLTPAAAGDHRLASEKERRSVGLQSGLSMKP